MEGNNLTGVSTRLHTQEQASMNVGMQYTQKPGEIYCHINKNIKKAEGKNYLFVKHLFILRTIKIH